MTLYGIDLCHIGVIFGDMGVVRMQLKADKIFTRITICSPPPDPQDPQNQIPQTKTTLMYRYRQRKLKHEDKETTAAQ